jgi:Zn ribbon nucleic-acid-binding protein
MVKFCPTCNQEKNITEFNKNKTRKDGYQRECRECNHTHHNKHYRTKKSPRLKENLKEGYKICTGCKQELPLNNFKPGKGRFGVGATCKICFNKKWNEYQKQTGQNKKHNKLKRQTNPQWKLKANLRGRYLDALKRHTSGGKVNKYHSAIELIGCDIEFYKQYLEQQFKPDMTWGNHGILWEIDHIKPCASFDLTDTNQQKECFHHLNTQPLYYSDNRSKGSKYL